MYVCICARVRECELRSAIRAGARDEETIGDACGAGTGCGTCLDRVEDVLIEEEMALLPAATAGVLTSSAAGSTGGLGWTTCKVTPGLSSSSMSSSPLS